MDTEEGVEVVWNEVQFSDKKVFKSFEVGLCLLSNNSVLGGILGVLRHKHLWNVTVSERHHSGMVVQWQTKCLKCKTKRRCALCQAGADTRDVWEPDAGGASEHRKVSQVLAGHEREQSEGETQNTADKNKRFCELCPEFRRFLSFRATQVIFITEYMSSGSLKQFLKKTKKNHKTMNVKVRRFIDHWKWKAGGQRHLLAEIWQNLNTLVLSVCLRHGSVGARRYFLHSGRALRIQYYPLNSSANLLLKLKCVGKLKIFSQLNIQRQLCVGWFVQKL